MTDNFPERSARLRTILKDTSKTLERPLLHEVVIAPDALARLQAACVDYLMASLWAAYPHKDLPYDVSALTEYEDDILALPNKTPNGLLLPKKETLSAYGGLHQMVAEVTKGFGIDQHVASIHAPVNIRLVTGTPSPNDDRPRASRKLHSDIWAGEFSNTVMLFLTALGDIGGNGIEFFEPTTQFLDYCHPLPDYLDGAGLEKDSTPYRCSLKPGHAYFTDPFLLHRTIKSSPRIRLSIDYRFVTNIPCATDVEVETERHADYIDLETWYEIGKTKSLRTEASVRESKADHAAAARNAYAARYTVGD